MMLHIPNVFTPEQVARCKDVMMKAAWVDGNVTAGPEVWGSGKVAIA